MILSIFGHGSSSSWAENTFSRPLVPQQIPQTRLLHLLMEQMVAPQHGVLKRNSSMVLTVFEFATKGQDENYTGGLVAALVALSGERQAGIDKNTIFYAIPPLTCHFSSTTTSSPWILGF
nr:hypothetical protein CFP56_27414 [Quercus suber]